MAETITKRPSTVSSRRELATGRRYDADGRMLGHKPTEQYLSALLQQGFVEQSAQRALDEQVATLLKDTHELGLPDIGVESEEFRGGHAMELVQQIVEFWPRPPDLAVPTPGVGQDPENFANQLEAGLNATLAALSKAKRGPGGLFYDHLKRQVAAYGRGYGVLLLDRRHYRDMPMPPLKGDGEYDLDTPERAKSYLEAYETYTSHRMPPLTLRSLPARRVLPFFDEDGLAECFWLSTERAWEVKERADARGVNLDRLGGWLNEDFDAHSAQSITVVHYANRSYCAELVSTPGSYPPTTDNTLWNQDCQLLGDPYPHGIGRIPVTYFPGMTTPLEERHLQAVSVVWQMRNTITMYDRIASMKATAIRTWAWPTPVLKTSLVNANLIEAGDDGRPRPVQLTPGLVVTLWGDEELYFLAYQGQGPDQDEMLGILRAQLDRLGLPNVQQQADGSGYLFAQMRAAMRGKWGAIMTGLVQGWEDLAWVLLDYFKLMPGTIWVPTVAEVGWGGMGKTANSRTRERSSYLRLKPEQLRGRSFQVVATLEPDKTLDMVAMAQAGNALLPLGVPKRYIWEHILGIKDTSELKYQFMLEELEALPEYKQAVYGAAMKEGNILTEDAASGGAKFTPEQLLQFAPEQIMAMVQAGLVDQAMAQQVIQMQQANVGQGQIGGALQGGQMPVAPQGPFAAPGGAPGMTPLQGGVGAPPGVSPMAGPLGALGGAASPAAFQMAPAAPRPPGIGRAAGQSRQPPRR